ncbi:stalk domain-containing protein [Clostridium perfringens]|uniref:Copper amine oxidase-like N-terminal domain-containing protein n=1 Tax=Clostridium perfringens TaxID=1502 RepID=A0A140GQX4_CLOPF|nr:stalk domain-containing protein [Clostridium perfringens]AMN30933.1 hypothetical protein JFP838_pA0017 [Clostridium perfringens]
MNKKFICLGLVGATILPMTVPLIPYAISFKDHLLQFENKKEDKEIKSTIEKSGYSKEYKEHLIKTLEILEECDKINDLNKKLDLLNKASNELLIKLNDEDLSHYQDNDCTSYLMNLLIHKSMSFVYDNNLEIKTNDDLIFNIYKKLVDIKNVNTFNKSYIDGIYNTVKEYPCLTKVEVSKWKELKDESDKFYDELNKAKKEDVIEEKDKSSKELKDEIDSKTSKEKEQKVEVKEEEKSDKSKLDSKDQEQGDTPKTSQEAEHSKTENNINLNDNSYITNSIFPDDIKKELVVINDNLKNSLSDTNKDTIKKAMDSFLNLRIEHKILVKDKTELVYRQFDVLMECLDKLNVDDRRELIVDFTKVATKLYTSEENNKVVYLKAFLGLLDLKYSSTDETISSVMTTEGEKIDSYNKMLKDEASKKEKGAIYVENGKIDNSKSDDGVLPGFKPWKPDPVEELPLPEIFITNIEYKSIDGICFKFTYTKDLKGELVKTEKEKTDGLYCGLIDTQMSKSEYQGKAKQMTASYWYSLNHEDVSEADKSNQYYFYKLANSISYINSGINTNKEGKLTYVQVKNLLYQISLKSGYPYMDDKDKFLIIVDGKPVIIKEDKKDYSFDEVNNLLGKANKVTIKLMTKDEAKELNDKNLDNIKNVRNLNINGQDMVLEPKPIINNNKLLLPLETLAKELKINISKDNGNYKFSKNKVELTVQPNNNQIILNENPIALSTNPILENDVLFMESEDFLSAFGYSLKIENDRLIIK